MKRQCMKRIIYILCMLIAYCYVWIILAHAHNQIDYNDKTSFSIISHDLSGFKEIEDIFKKYEIALLREQVSDCDGCYQEARFRGRRGGGYRRPPTYSAPRVRAPPKCVTKPRIAKSFNKKARKSLPYRTKQTTRRVSKAVKKGFSHVKRSTQRTARKAIKALSRIRTVPRNAIRHPSNALRSIGNKARFGGIRVLNNGKHFVHKAKRSARYASIKTQRKARTSIKRTSAVFKAAFNGTKKSFSKINQKIARLSPKKTFANLRSEIALKKPTLSQNRQSKIKPLAQKASKPINQFIKKIKTTRLAKKGNGSNKPSIKPIFNKAAVKQVNAKSTALPVKQNIIPHNKKTHPPKNNSPPEKFFDVSSISSKVSQKQNRHVKGHKDWLREGKKGYFNNFNDAQKVLNAFKNGEAKVIGFDNQGQPVVQYDKLTGYNNNKGAGFINQPTNIFKIKGTKRPSVVPINPNWKN